MCRLLALACRADTLLGMATHRILHKVEPGKLKMELTDKKGANTGEIQFILQASGGRFAQQSLMRHGTQPMRVPLPLVPDQEQQVLLAPKVTPVVPLAALVSLRECVV